MCVGFRESKELEFTEIVCVPLAILTSQLAHRGDHAAAGVDDVIAELVWYDR